MRIFIQPLYAPVLVTILLVNSACHHLTLEHQPTATGLPPTPVQTFELNYFLFGFIPATRLPSQDKICASSQIETMDFEIRSADFWLAIVTLGIYTPQTVKIICAGPRA